MRPVPTSAEIAAGVREPAPHPFIYENIVKAYWERVLVDPASAIYRFGSPVKGYSTRLGPQTVYGWLIPFEVNAKNQFGGYTGAKTYEAFFYEGRLRVIYNAAKYPEVVFE
jgi:hypothetical protein